jgi:hypothetical protein
MSSKRKSRREIITESFLRSLNEGLGGEQREILKDNIKRGVNGIYLCKLVK